MWRFKGSLRCGWNRKQRGCKPGYVTGPCGDGCQSFIYAVRCRTAEAVYPPAMGEQPLNAGILDLAAHETCGALHCCLARWALTSPFHPYPFGRLFSVTLLCCRQQVSVRNHGALCCPDFPLTARVSASDWPPLCQGAKVRNNFECWILNVELKHKQINIQNSKFNIKRKAQATCRQAACAGWFYSNLTTI